MAVYLIVMKEASAFLSCLCGRMLDEVDLLLSLRMGPLCSEAVDFIIQAARSVHGGRAPAFISCLCKFPGNKGVGSCVLQDAGLDKSTLCEPANSF